MCWFRRRIGVNASRLSAYYGLNTRAYYQGMFLSDLCRSLLLIMLAFTISFTATGDALMSLDARLRLLPILLSMGVSLGVSGWLVEHGYQKLSRKVMLISCTMGCIVTVVLFGGFSNSVATPILIAPMIIAFCISPKREAIWTSLINGLIPPMIELTAYQSGYQIPDYSSHVSPAAHTFFLMVVLFAVAYISLSFLQRTNDSEM